MFIVLICLSVLANIGLILMIVYGVKKYRNNKI